MPNKEKSKKIWTDADYIYYVVNYLQKAINELDKHNWDKEKFLEDSSFQEICSFYSIQIGEYAKGLSQEFREKYPYKLWRGFAAVRDVYAHSYHRFNEDTAWETLTKDYPKFYKNVWKFAKKTIGKFLKILQNSTVELREHWFPMQNWSELVLKFVMK